MPVLRRQLPGPTCPAAVAGSFRATKRVLLFVTASSRCEQLPYQLLVECFVGPANQRELYPHRLEQRRFRLEVELGQLLVAALLPRREQPVPQGIPRQMRRL